MNEERKIDFNINKGKFLLLQHEFCRNYFSELIHYLHGTSRNSIVFLLSTLTLFLINTSKILHFGANTNYIIGLAILAIAVMLILNMVMINIYFGRLLTNDLMALWIEKVLGIKKIGLWHVWYGFDSDNDEPINDLTRNVIYFYLKSHFITPITTLYGLMAISASIVLFIILFFGIFTVYKNLGLCLGVSFLITMFFIAFQRKGAYFQVQSLSPTLKEVLTEYEYKDVKERKRST